MKRLLFLVIVLNSYLVFGQDIPEKLLLSSKSFSENQNLYPIYRIDLIVFSHKQINERDKQEQFPKLDGFIYSPDLLKLLDTPNLLVKKQAIKIGLTLKYFFKVVGFSLYSKQIYLVLYTFKQRMKIMVYMESF